MAQRVYRANPKSPEARAKERATRERFQREKPTLEQLIASGDYTPPMTQEEYFSLQTACRDLLRPLREAAGLSLAQMSERTGIDRAAIQKLETGVHMNPTIGTISRYLQALGKRLELRVVDEPSTAT